MAEKHLLITGFEPFGGEQVNPSWEAVQRLPDRVGRYRLHKLQIPTVFGLAAQRVLEAALELRPQMILCIGQAGGREAVTPERVAINLQDAKIPDNLGSQPVDTPVLPGGPAAYFSTVPVKTMAEAICAAGLPARVSNTAGTFVCNDTLYRLLHHFGGQNTRVGFIHVPWMDGQGSPCLSLGDIGRALEIAIEAIE